MTSPLSRQFGYTLIELMIVVLIVLVLSGGSLTAYLTFNQKELVKNDTRQLTTELNRVKSLAASLQYPSGCTSLKGYNIKSATLDGELTGVTVTAVCEPEDIVNTSVKILSGTVFTSSFDITFVPGSGYLNGNLEKEIAIKNPKEETATKTITISPYGVINTD